MVLALSTLPLALSVGCRKTAPTSPHPNVLLVTVDTFRADRLGTGVTPALDRLAASSLRFTAARSAVPLTLPSHTTILTGLMPPAHGVRANGVDALSEAHKTIPTVLKTAGYQTAAFIGAFVLDRRFGLSQGFDTYDDQIPRDPSATERLEAERPASAVVDRALAWLDQSIPISQPAQPVATSPWFMWIHLYDPHAPYNPPPPFVRIANPESRTPTPKDRYDGELRYADAQIARVFEWLRRHQLLEQTLIVVAGDHGEGLGDHGEATHGMLLYESTLRVPLVIAAPGQRSAVRDDPVTLADIAPTILRAVGAAPLTEMKGRDLLEVRLKPDPTKNRTSNANDGTRNTNNRASSTNSGAGNGNDGANSTNNRASGTNNGAGNGNDGTSNANNRSSRTNNGAGPADNGVRGVRLQPDLPDLYSETEYPRVAGWSPLQALTDGRWKTIRAGNAAEVYDLQNDPGEQRDVVATQANVATAMTVRMDTIRATAATAPREISPDAAERLRALGYVASAVQSNTVTSGPNPAKMIGAWNRFEDALSAIADRRAATVLPALRALASANPAAPVFQTTYARALQESGNVTAALAVYRQAARRWPTDALLLHDLAVAARDAATRSQGRAANALRDEAARAEQAAIVIAPNTAAAHNGLGLLAIDQNRPQEAVKEFQAAAAADSNNASYWTNLGNARREMHDAGGAEQAYRRALDADPRTADAANGLGVLLVEAQRPADAVTWFERATAAAPDFIEARLNLAIALQQSGKTARAAQEYKRVLAANGATREKEAASKLLATMGER